MGRKQCQRMIQLRDARTMMHICRHGYKRFAFQNVIHKRCQISPGAQLEKNTDPISMHCFDGLPEFYGTRPLIECITQNRFGDVRYGRPTAIKYQ